MGWWFDRNNNCTYEEWVVRAGGLVLFLDTICKQEKYKTVLELGTGNSTHALARHCGRVVTIDENENSPIVPVAEQGPSGLGKEFWIGLKKEDNVDFYCGDILTMDLSPLKNYDFDAVFFDLGNTYADKYLYRLAYSRLMGEGIIYSNITILADNSEDQYVKEFSNFLESLGGYKVVDNGTQFIATKGV
jgi:predicted O-methyltransferase YrrM